MANHKSQIAKKFKGHRCTGALVHRRSAPNRVRGIGFTLVEMITVLAIMAIIMAFSIPMFSRFTAGTRLDTASRDISTALRTARSYAITQREDYSVGLDSIQNEFWISLGAASADIFNTTSNQPTNVVDKVFHLPQTISIVEGGETTFPGPDPSNSSNKVYRATFSSTGTGPNGSVCLMDTKGRTNWVTVVNTTGRVKIKKEK